VEENPQGRPDATREWLLQLERRVDELERLAEKQARNRRRSFLFMALAGVLYILVLYWEMNQALPI